MQVWKKENFAVMGQCPAFSFQPSHLGIESLSNHHLRNVVVVSVSKSDEWRAEQ